MIRAFTFLLVMAALLIQLGVGALPASEICVSLGAQPPKCSCCQKSHSAKACCSTDGCERCVRVPAPERQVAPQAKLRTARVTSVVGSTVAMPAMVWQSEPLSMAVRPAARTSESPPELARLRTTRLVL